MPEAEEDEDCTDMCDALLELDVNVLVIGIEGEDEFSDVGNVSAKALALWCERLLSPGLEYGLVENCDVVLSPEGSREGGRRELCSLSRRLVLLAFDLSEAK